MGSKGFAVILIAALLAVLAQSGDCQCAPGDHRSSSEAVRARPVCCPQSEAPAKCASPSHEDCCGKCRLEKNAVPFEKSFYSPLSSSENPRGKASFFNVTPRTTDRPFETREDQIHSPPLFFIQNVLNTTFSFREPPKG